MSKVIDREHDYKEKMSEAMLQHVAQIAEDELLDEAVDGDVVFSERHEKEMAKLFASMEPKKTKVVPLKRVLILVAVLVGLLAAAVGTIATNPKIINMFRKSTDTYTEIRFDEAEVIGGTYSTDSVTLGYIPDGMELTESSKGEHSEIIMFQKEEKVFQLRISQARMSSVADKENSSEETITIWNKEAHLQERAGQTSILWSIEDCSYMLVGNIGREELIKIAENIQ